MHIGYDISQIGPAKAGCGQYADALIRALIDNRASNTYSLYTSFGDFYFNPAMRSVSPISAVNVQYGPRHSSREEAAGFWNADDLERALGAPDVIHANNFWCPVKIKRAKLIYTVYDLSFALEPTWTTEENRTGCFAGVVNAAAYADWIISISESSKKHFLDLFPFYPDDRVRVVYPISRFKDGAIRGKKPKAVDHLVEGSFWLSVGTVEPRKNQKRLVEAYAEYARADVATERPLVLAGGAGWLMNDFERTIEKLGLSSRVIMTGYVSDEELAWLYQNCYANLYGSMFEGFGLPVLEGMQFGAPTICSNTSSLPEVAGSAAMLLSPTDVEAWARTMVELGDNPKQREEMSKGSLRQAAKFSWRDSMALVDNLYQEAFANPKRWPE